MANYICPRCGRTLWRNDLTNRYFCPKCSRGILDVLVDKMAPLGLVFLAGAVVIAFIQRYWMYIVSIVIVVACILICRNIHRKVYNPGSKIALTIFISAILIIGVFVGVPMIGSSSRPTTLVSRNQTSSTQAVRYMVVNSDALNVRTGPSANTNVIGQLRRNARVQILDDSGQWYKIRVGDTEGYVNSAFLAPAR